MPEYDPRKENRQESVEHGFLNTWFGYQLREFWRCFAQQAEVLVFKKAPATTQRHDHNANAANTLVDALTRLGDLKERGFLTDQEFSDAKAELLHPNKRDKY